MSTKENATAARAETPVAPKKSMSDAQRISTLVVGDVLVFLIFSAIGRSNHGEPVGLDSLLQIALTAAPFAIGWFLVSPFVGAFRRGLETQPRAMAIRTALAWVVAWPVGLLLRIIFVDHGVLTVGFVTFAIITLVVNMVFLLVWRWPFALTRSLRQS